MRHDANNLAIDAVHRDHTADDRWITAEFVIPERVTEEDHVISSGRIFSWFKATSCSYRHSEYRK